MVLVANFLNFQTYFIELRFMSEDLCTLTVINMITNILRTRPSPVVHMKSFLCEAALSF